MQVILFILSASGLACAVIAGQVKTIKSVLFFEILANLFMAVNFLLGDGLVGSLTCFIASLQTAFNYYFRKNDTSLHSWSLVMFSVLYIFSAVLSWNGIKSVFPLISIGIFEWAVFSKVTYYRYLKFVSNGAWIAYSILIKNYSALLTYVILFVSLLISIIRYRKKV